MLQSIENMALIKMQIKRVLFVISLLPIVGMFFAIIWSILFNWEDSTATHCRVRNYLPSLSAAIGFAPQAYIWRFCISLHCTPRIILAFGYWKWFHSIPLNRHAPLSRYRDSLISITIIAHLIELFGLLLLTVVSSKESPDVHELGFILFISGSLTFMVLHTWVISPMNSLDTKYARNLAKRKKHMAIINILSFISCMYFFVRHNNYCEHGVYSLFAIFEYIVILSNVAYHHSVGMAIHDFSFVLCDNEEFKQQ